MSGVGSDPISAPDTWNQIYLSGVWSPGICIVGEFKRANEWDQKKGKGTLGATLTYVGKPAAKGSIEFLLWTTAHFDAWASFITLLKYDPTKAAAQAIDIYHPSLVDIDVSSVVTENIGNIIHKGQGLYARTISFIEFLQPPKQSAVSTPKKAADKPPPGPAASVGDTEVDAQIKKEAMKTVLLTQSAFP